MLFLSAFALFPISLVTTIAARTRQLQAEVASSRARIVRTESKTRRRLERDLHDGVQQQLVALLSLLELGGRQLDRADLAASSDTIRLAADRVEDTIGDLRALVQGIHPPALTDHGLVAAVTDHLAQPGMPVRVEADAMLGRLRADVEAAAFYVVCEALTNSRRHGRADEAVVSIRRDGNALGVRVHDDGEGFDPAQVACRGLLGARDRIESLGGRFTLDARPGAGTCVAFELPVGGRP